jgi:acyl-CoA synthetase (AMP-forming)/AMP-acid ligase II
MQPATGDTFWAMLQARVALTPDRTMLIDEHDRRLTWAEFSRWVERVAAGLSGLGIGRGSAVSWQLPTRMETIVLSMALARLGAVQNPIIHLYRQREVASLLRATKAEWFVMPGIWRGFDYSAMAAAILDEHTRAPFRVLDGYADLPEGDPATLPPPQIDGDEVRWLYSTSGTTSEPKAVRHSDGTLIAGGTGIAIALDPQPDDVGSITYPYAHIGGPDNFVMMMRAALTTVITEAFVPADTYALFRRHGVTMTGGSTAHYQALLAYEAQHPGARAVPTLRSFSGGGAPKPPELYWRVKQQTGAIIRHGYGMTECPMIACGTATDTDEQLANSDGLPVVGCEILVVDESGVPVPAGVDGDIRVRGTMLAKGYLDPEQTSEAFLPDGWFKTGDRGHLRTDGRIAITGRSKELIIRKGENVSPREIEDVLIAHPAVGAVAVIGLPDDERGERVCAVVETAVGAAPLTFQAMAEHCRSAGLMTQKIPEQLELVDALPRNPTMKILKRELVEQFAHASRGVAR